jgi:virginiamycin B lyase
VWCHIKLETRGRKLVFVAIISALFVVGCLPLEAQNTTISGTIEGNSAKPLPGALVKVRSEELNLSFVVVSQAQGRYTTPNLLPGKYTVQGFGPDFQSELMGPIEIHSGQKGKMDLTLNTRLQLPSPFKRMTDADYIALMPEGKGKNLVAGRCATCHSLDWVLAARKTAEEWQETVGRMQYALQGRERPLNRAEELYQLDTVVDYLGKTLTPDVPVDPRIIEQGLPEARSLSHPNRNLAGAFLKGTRPYIAMEFSLPPNSLPHDIAVDSDGIAWVSETNSGMLGRFDPNSLSYTRISPSYAKNLKLQLNSIAVDPQGDVWFVDEGPNACMVRYKPRSREFISYPLPQYQYSIPHGSTPAHLVSLRFLDGNVWATGPAANWIVKLEPNSGKTTQYPVPHGSSPYGLAIGGDHRIWYAAEIGNFIGRLDPTNGRLMHYDVPTAKSLMREMAADLQGNLWVAATASGKLLKMNVRDGTLTEFDPPSHDSGPYAVAVDTKRNVVWFSEIYADKIARFDPETKTFIEFPAPSADLDVRRIEVDRHNPNRVWWAAGTAAKIGYLEVME